MYKVKVLHLNIVFLLFLFIFPFGIVGDLGVVFDIPVLENIKFLRSVSYFILFLLFFLYINSITKKITHRFHQNWILPLAVFVFFPLVILFIFLLQILTHLDVVGSVGGGGYLSTFNYNAPIFVSCIAMFVLGFVVIEPLKNNMHTVFYLWVFCSLVILYCVDFTKLTLNFMASKDPSNRSFTLMLSDSYALVSFFALMVTKRHIPRLLIVFVSLSCLFFISSRTAFVVFTLTVLTVFSRGLLNVRALLPLLLFMFGVYVFILFLYDNSTGYSSRLFNLSSNDASYLARVDMFLSGLEGITNNVFFGDFSGQLMIASDDKGARWGGYIHNFFSYFRQFGIIAFLLVVSILISSLYSCYIAFKKRLIDSELSVVAIILYIVLIYTLSRGYVYSWLFLLPGLSFYILSVRIIDEKDNL